MNSEQIQQQIEEFVSRGGAINVIPAPWESKFQRTDLEIDMEAFAGRLGISKKVLKKAMDSGTFKSGWRKGKPIPPFEWRVADRKVFASKTNPPKKAWFKLADVEAFCALGPR